MAGVVLKGILFVLVFQLEYHFYSEVEEDNFGVGVLAYVVFGTVEDGDYLLYVALVDEWGKSC